MTYPTDVAINSSLAHLLALLLVILSRSSAVRVTQIPMNPSPSPYAGMNYFGESQKRDGPCLYPSPYPDRNAFVARCNLPMESIKRYNICDASGNAVSITEVQELTNQLDRFYIEKIEKGRTEGFGHCVCEPNRWPKRDEYCWYRFGFAFLHSFVLPKYELPADVVNQVCQTGNLTHPVQLLPAQRQIANWTAEAVFRYATQFAQILRLRWNMSSCGDDILLLIVKKRPSQLVKNDKLNANKYPMIFLSLGAEVVKRIEAYDQEDLTDVLLMSNKHLDQGFALQEVLKSFMNDYKNLLNHADMMNFKPKNRNSIPTWAIAVFAICFGILLCLLLGYALFKSRGRRGPNRSKAADGGRKWKAGFVGVLAFIGKKDDGRDGRGGGLL